SRLVARSGVVQAALPLNAAGACLTSFFHVAGSESSFAPPATCTQTRLGLSFLGSGFGGAFLAGGVFGSGFLAAGAGPCSAAAAATRTGLAGADGGSSTAARSESGIEILLTIAASTGSSSPGRAGPGGRGSPRTGTGFAGWRTGWAVAPSTE